MLIGGMRALLVQALHPLAMAAMDQRSGWRNDPWGRLRRTSEFVTITIYGESDAARAAGARVRAIHRRISGVDSVTGRPYRADDPELLLWIHCVEVDSFLAAYRRYGGRLSAPDADRYVDEMRRAGALVGLEERDMPRSVAELDAYLTGVKGLCVTPGAREGLRLVLSPPVSLPTRVAWVVPASAAIAILPQQARELYGLPWFEPAGPAVRLAAIALCKAMRAVLPPPPTLRDALERARLLPGAA